MGTVHPSANMRLPPPSITEILLVTNVLLIKKRRQSLAVTVLVEVLAARLRPMVGSSLLYTEHRLSLCLQASYVKISSSSEDEFSEA